MASFSISKLKMLFRRVRSTHHLRWCVERTLRDYYRFKIELVLFHFQLKKPIITITYNDGGDLWQGWRVVMSF